MVASRVDLILVAGPELYLKAAIAASPTVPIVVFANNYDPIALGYVDNLALLPMCSVVGKLIRRCAACGSEFTCSGSVSAVYFRQIAAVRVPQR